MIYFASLIAEICLYDFSLLFIAFESFLSILFSFNLLARFAVTVFLCLETTFSAPAGLGSLDEP